MPLMSAHHPYGSTATDACARRMRRQSGIEKTAQQAPLHPHQFWPRDRENPLLAVSSNVGSSPVVGSCMISQPTESVFGRPGHSCQ
jgi:hypothetical protein